MVRKGYKVEILRYKMSERETRSERMRGNVKKWRQHDQKGTNLWIIIWEMNIHETC